MKNYQFKISNKIISQNSKPFLIAEVGQSHEGDLKKVLKLLIKFLSLESMRLSFKPILQKVSLHLKSHLEKKINCLKIDLITGKVQNFLKINGYK